MTSLTVAFAQSARCVPTDMMVDGPLLGNGDIGVVVAGPPEKLRFHIGKNDFWGIHTQAPMTVGQIELLVPDLAGASYKGECDMRRAYWQGSLGKASTSLTVRAWVDANANRLVIELANASKTPLSLAVHIPGGGPVATNTMLRDPDTGLANARKVAVATRILGEKSDASGITLAPGRGAILVAAVLSTLDAKDPLPDARNAVAALTPEKVTVAAVAHEAWWEAFWKKSSIEIPDKVLEQHWYAAAQFHLVLQSHEGGLRFFPCWPKDQDARFDTLRAYGAFLVSAEFKGVVGGVKIVSEKGRLCTVVNPWPGMPVQLSRNGKKAERVDGDRFTIKTSVNETIELRP